MAEEIWRPLDVDTEDSIASYDALHDGVPAWMSAPFWSWVRDRISKAASYSDGSGRFPVLDVELAEALCQTLQIALPNVRLLLLTKYDLDSSVGQVQINSAMTALRGHEKPLRIADYLLAHAADANAAVELDALLTRSKSAFTVGARAGKPGLTRRVPVGVQMAADAVMASSAMAGVRLAEAWEYLFGTDPKPSEAYRRAILAVEDAAVPVVSPKNERATLGTVLAQMEQQGDWKLPMDREHSNAPTNDVLVSMMRMLWHGQHDRHGGGQPSAPGNVSESEARVAVMVAATLVDWFTSGLVARPSK